MAPKASIFRLDPDAQTALSHLSRLSGRPMNKLVNEAVRDYLLKTSDAEHTVEHTLAGLRAYRDRMAQVAESPAQYAAERGPPADPVAISTAREFLRRVAARFSVGAAFVFGSRARGTHRADSDVDIALVLRGPRGKLMETSLELADIAYDVLLDTNLYIQPMPVWEVEWAHPETHSNPRLIENIKREGIRL
jgi:predicted nucleotidyltransferase